MQIVEMQAGSRRDIPLSVSLSAFHSSMPQTIAVLDFGSQYTQVIARRIRECQVYSKIYHFTTPRSSCGRTASSASFSRRAELGFCKTAPLPDRGIFELGVPVLASVMGFSSSVTSSAASQRKAITGSTAMAPSRSRNPAGCSPVCPKNSGSGIRTATSQQAPPGFRAIGTTENSPFAAIEDLKRNFYGIQFHPEVFHTERGVEVIRNFLVGVCGARQDWTMKDFIAHAVNQIRTTVGQSHVILGLSGGVDSSVAAALIHRAIGKQLTCVFVDNGLLRQGERQAVADLYGKHFKIDLRVVDASRLFLRRLKGVAEPEAKRKIIGRTFVAVFEKSLKSIGHADFLAQGTLYPDVIESVAIGNNPAALIKSHHNVGGLPARMKLKLLERSANFSRTRSAGSAPRSACPRRSSGASRSPAGPGRRLLGEVSAEKLEILRRAMPSSTTR